MAITDKTDYGLTQSLWLAEKRAQGVPVWKKGFTVDDDTCRDMDDAIAIQQLDSGLYKVHVAIALVPATVPLHSDAYYRAQQKITSRYYDAGPSYMLPRPVTEGLCSLNPGEYKPALGYSFVIDTHNETMEYTLGEVIFQSQGKMNAKQFKESGQADEFIPVVNHLRDTRLYNQYVNRRTQEGVPSATPPAYVPLTHESEQGISHAIIEEFMLLTNAVTADYAYRNRIPYIYRTSLQPETQGGRRTKIYTTYAEAFSDNGYAHYGHITSPIRRLGDMCNQFHVMNHLNGKAPAFTKDDMEAIAQKANNPVQRFQDNHDDIVQAPYIPAPSRFPKRQGMQQNGE